MTSTSFRSLRFLGVAAFLVGFGLVRAESASAPAAETPAAKPSALSQHSIDKLAAPAFKALKLGDPQKEKEVGAILASYFQAVEGWHRHVDRQLAKLWSDWADARGTGHQDETKAAEFATKIDAIYAEFRPQHDQCLGQLAKVLTPEQVEIVENALTREPGLERTYHAFLQIIPNLTASQKAFIHDTLLIARDQALDTLAKKEKINLFKKQKVKVQLYIEAQGYDWKSAYAAYAKKINDETAAKKQD